LIDKDGKVKLLILLELQEQTWVPFWLGVEHWQLSTVETPLTDAHLGWSWMLRACWPTQHLQAFDPSEILLQSHTGVSRLLTTT
jgi:hypothetical protein